MSSNLLADRRGCAVNLLKTRVAIGTAIKVAAICVPFLLKLYCTPSRNDFDPYRPPMLATLKPCLLNPSSSGIVIVAYPSAPGANFPSTRPVRKPTMFAPKRPFVIASAKINDSPVLIRLIGCLRRVARFFFIRRRAMRQRRTTWLINLTHQFRRLICHQAFLLHHFHEANLSKL